MKHNSSSIKRILGKTLSMMVLLMFITTILWAEGEGATRSIGFFDILLLPRVWVGAIFCLIGLGLLTKSWVNHNLRFIFLTVIFFVFGIIAVLPLGKFARGMGLHPSPVCTVTKPFLFLNAGRTVPVIFLAILASIALLSVVGNKLFCGWVCPIGAIQEIFHRIPLFKALKIKLPFRTTNLIRTTIFIAFLAVIFSVGISIYDYFNPFEFLHWGFEPMAIAILLVTLVGAVFIFRPFCYLICPLGLFTWTLEHLSLIKVKVNKTKCITCNLCINMSPCPAVPSILEERKLRPDCHACGRCLEVCPENALRFKK